VPVGQRVTTKTVKIGKSLEVELVDRHQVPFYWGFSVDGPQRSLGSLLKKQPFDLVIATSRYGSPFADVAGELCEKWGEADQVLVIFGSPTSGVNEIVQREGLCLGKLVDFIVNSIPLQGTATVRTEEAIFATFAILNVLSPLKRLSA
jgi:predicted SPOUT superfamily RNA methylase MTH1